MRNIVYLAEVMMYLLSLIMPRKITGSIGTDFMACILAGRDHFALCYSKVLKTGVVWERPGSIAGLKEQNLWGDMQ